MKRAASFVVYVLLSYVGLAQERTPVRESVHFEPFFEEVHSFIFRTPVRFDPDGYLANLARKPEIYFNAYDTLLSSKYISSRDLKAGVLYEVVYYKLPEHVTIDQCRSFLENKNAIFCGAQGLSLLVQFKPLDIQEGWTMSLDKEERLLHYDCHGIDSVRVEETWYNTSGGKGIPWILLWHNTRQKEFLLLNGRVSHGDPKIPKYMVAFLEYKP